MAKDSPRITAGELQRLVESWGQKPKKKKNQTSPISPHVVREGFKKNCPHSSKNNSSKFSCQTRLELQWHWLLLSDETEKKLFGSKPTRMSLVQTGIKKYPMSTVKSTAGSLMLWACFSAEVLNILFRCMASWILSNTNR